MHSDTGISSLSLSHIHTISFLYTLSIRMLLVKISKNDEIHSDTFVLPHPIAHHFTHSLTAYRKWVTPTKVATCLHTATHTYIHAYTILEGEEP